jgi:hypothetical protein
MSRGSYHSLHSQKGLLQVHIGIRSHLDIFEQVTPTDFFHKAFF